MDLPMYTEHILLEDVVSCNWYRGSQPFSPNNKRHKKTLTCKYWNHLGRAWIIPIAPAIPRNFDTYYKQRVYPLSELFPRYALSDRALVKRHKVTDDFIQRPKRPRSTCNSCVMMSKSNDSYFFGKRCMEKSSGNLDILKGWITWSRKCSCWKNA